MGHDFYLIEFLNSSFIGIFSAWRLVFWNSIHLEAASGPFCLLLHSPWPLVFALCLFEGILSFMNLYCWKGLHFSWSNSLIFILLLGIFSFIICTYSWGLFWRRFLSSRSL